MAESISQRELRNRSGEIMRALDEGRSYIVTRRGIPVGELRPVRRRHLVGIEAVISSLAGGPHIDGDRLRSDIDRFVDQDPAPGVLSRR